MANRQRIDPYAVLGVPRDASPLQVARAHRRLAKRFHPDLGKHGDAERMRLINEAWQILSIAARRNEYDVAHPSSAGGPSGHWAATRRPIRPTPPSTTRTWATWRATAEATRTAPRTARQPGEVRVSPTRRPPPMAPQEQTFRDSGGAALAAAAVILLLLAVTIAASRLT
jgi:hypothetical protein